MQYRRRPDLASGAASGCFMRRTASFGITSSIPPPQDGRQEKQLLEYGVIMYGINQSIRTKVSQASERFKRWTLLAWRQVLSTCVFHWQSPHGKLEVSIEHRCPSVMRFQPFHPPFQQTPSMWSRAGEEVDSLGTTATLRWEQPQEQLAMMRRTTNWHTHSSNRAIFVYVNRPSKARTP